MRNSFPLKPPAPFQFRPLDKRLYYLIERDAAAKIAFRKMTSGSRAIDPSWLLYMLGIEGGERCTKLFKRLFGRLHAR